MTQTVAPSDPRVRFVQWGTYSSFSPTAIRFPAMSLSADAALFFMVCDINLDPLEYALSWTVSPNVIHVWTANMFDGSMLVPQPPTENTSADQITSLSSTASGYSTSNPPPGYPRGAWYSDTFMVHADGYMIANPTLGIGGDLVLSVSGPQAGTANIQGIAVAVIVDGTA